MTWITPSLWPIIFYLSLPISLKRRHRMITLSSSSLASFWSPLSYYTQSHLTSVPGLVIEVEILLKGHHLLPRPASRLPCLAVLQLGKKGRKYHIYDNKNFKPEGGSAPCQRRTRSAGANWRPCPGRCSSGPTRTSWSLT